MALMNRPLAPDPWPLTAGPWPHRLAWLLVCAMFSLIWLGTSVTTYGVGMAVPDWPTTYGYWFYPVQEWLTGSRGLFLAYSCRLMAQAVGVIAITLAVVLWTLDRRKWMRTVGVAVVAGGCLQCVLGGFRVLEDSIFLAKIHACTAPLVFALAAAIITLTSRRWQQPDPARGHPHARGLHRLALAITGALYLQIVLGVQLRHLSPDAGLGWFELWVWLKLTLAGLIAVAVVWLLVFLRRRVPEQPMIARRARILAALLLLQLILGAAVWVTNYGWPGWFKTYVWEVKYRVVAEGRLQVWITTAHAAAGSLNLVVSAALSWWSLRLLPGEPRSRGLR